MAVHFGDFPGVKPGGSSNPTAKYVDPGNRDPREYLGEYHTCATCEADVPMQEEKCPNCSCSAKKRRID